MFNEDVKGDCLNGHDAAITYYLYTTLCTIIHNKSNIRSVSSSLRWLHDAH